MKRAAVYRKITAAGLLILFLATMGLAMFPSPVAAGTGSGGEIIGGRTNPQGESNNNFHFTITSDPHGYHTIFGNVLQAINDGPGAGAFHITLGDENDTDMENRAVVDSKFGDSFIWYPLVGNHEAARPSDMNWLRNEYSNGNSVRTPLKEFTNQNGPAGSVETTYSFDYGNAHFIVLNEYWNGGTSSGSDVATDGNIVIELYNWLAADLASNTKPLVFVFGHEPAFPFNYQVGSSLDRYRTNRDAFWALLESKNVQAYFTGHSHYYSRHRGNKDNIGAVWQFDSGTAGSNLGDGFTYLDVIVSGDRVVVNVYRDGGTGVFSLIESIETSLRHSPTAVNDIYTVGEDMVLDIAAPGVLANDKDPDGNALTAVLVSGTSHGSLSLNANGAFTYTPDAGYRGSDSFTYKASDGSFDSATATVSINVMETTTVTVELKSSTGAGISGGVVQYYSGGWLTFGTTGDDGKVDRRLPIGTYRFRMTYAGASQEKSQNVTTSPVATFQTVLVTMKLLKSDGVTELEGIAQYSAGGTKTFGSGTTTTSMELLPLTYTFYVTYAGAKQGKSQNIVTNPAVTFQTKLVTMKLLKSDGVTELAGVAQYTAGGTRTFGSGTTTTDMELLPLNYTFSVTYAGAKQSKSQNVATSPVVIFQTTPVTMRLLQSDGVTELAGGAQYSAGGTKTFGSGTTTTTMELLPLTYTFYVSYGGVSQSKSQNVATSPVVTFQTVLVTMKLLKSDGVTELEGIAQYSAGGTKTFGSGTTTTSMELLPVNYTFYMTYAGARQTKQQNVATNPVVIFQTGQVHSDSGNCIQYYAGTWRTFTQDMELLPLAYGFRFNDGFPQTNYAIVAGTANHIH